MPSDRWTEDWRGIPLPAHDVPATRRGTEAELRARDDYVWRSEYWYDASTYRMREVRKLVDPNSGIVVRVQGEKLGRRV
ncbi:MAG: hypothetical protein Q8R28_15205 [Dehalococcoidia bacterium]|nr:hypothetical protein [Dehalococcoidia bacterium]